MRTLYLGALVALAVSVIGCSTEIGFIPVVFEDRRTTEESETSALQLGSRYGSVSVSSVDALRKAVKEAKTGDRILIAPGTYKDLGVIKISESNIQLSGASTSESAPSHTRTTFTGMVSILVSGSDNVVQGLHFDSTLSGSVVIFGATKSKKATRNLLSKLYFYGSGSSLTTCQAEFPKFEDATRCGGLVVFGKNANHNSLAHSVFRATQENVVKLNDLGEVTLLKAVPKRAVTSAHFAVAASIDETSQYNRIHHSIFVDIDQGNVPSNGGNAIMIGATAKGSVAGAVKRYNYAQVDHCLFQRVEGEIEIISSKTYGNLIVYNVFDNSRYGRVFLRAGGGSLVLGNVFRGTNGGVSVNGVGHSVRQNVFATHSTGAIRLNIGSDEQNEDGYVRYVSARGTDVAQNLIFYGKAFHDELQRDYDDKKDFGSGGSALEAGVDPGLKKIQPPLPWAVPFNNTFTQNRLIRIEGSGEPVTTEEGFDAVWNDFDGNTGIPTPEDRESRRISDYLLRTNAMSPRCLQVTTSTGPLATDPQNRFLLGHCGPDAMTNSRNYSPGRVALPKSAILPHVGELGSTFGRE